MSGTVRIGTSQEPAIAIPDFVSRLKWLQGDLSSQTAYAHKTLGGGKGQRMQGRDVSAIQWLVDNNKVNAKMEPLVLVITRFSTDWG